MKKEEKLLKTNGTLESNEYRKLIILIVIIAIVFLVFYGLTKMFTKENHDDIFKNDLNASEIQYKEIIIGNMFDIDGHYYVLLMEKDDMYKEYFNSYVSNINNLYTVDLSSAFNKKYLSDKYSYDEDDFKVKGTVLVEIENHKITNHFESKEEILKKLEELSE
jgi:hypothetical protein